MGAEPTETNQPEGEVLALPESIFVEMLAHVQAGYPNEACGVLAGAAGQVVKHYPTANASDTPETFSEIGSRELFAIWQEIDERDWTFFAYYHSHPRTPAYPSPRDIVLAQGWPGTFYLIFSLRDVTQPELRAFRVTSDRRVIEYPLLREV